MKTVINPGWFISYFVLVWFGFSFLGFFLLVFPEVRFFSRLDSPALVQGVFWGEISF